MFTDKWFGQYNYNKQKNIEIYGQPDPPAYDLTKIVVPVALYHAKNDWLSSTEVTTVKQLLLCYYDVFVQI